MSAPLRCAQCGAGGPRESSRFCPYCGLRLTTPEPEVGAATWRWSLRRWAILGVVLAVLALTATGLRITQLTIYSPDEPVRELLAYIESGDSAALADVLDVESGLLVDEVLTEGYTPPQDLRVTRVREEPLAGDITEAPSRDHAAVELAYTLGEEQHETEVAVRRETTGWLRRWEVAETNILLGALRIDSPFFTNGQVATAQFDVESNGEVHMVTVAEVNYAAEDGAFLALPGSYEITAQDDHPLYQPVEATTVEVTTHHTTHDPARVELDDAEPHPELVDDIADQISDFLGDCTESTQAIPGGNCPFQVERDAYFGIDEVHWTVLAEPEITLEVRDEAPGRTGMAVETTEPGTAQAEVTYTNVADEGGTEEFDFTVGGTASIDENGAVEWQP